MNPVDHCFREDNCAEHPDHEGPLCCCCGEPADAHVGCDCENEVESRWSSNRRSEPVALIDLREMIIDAYIVDVLETSNGMDGFDFALVLNDGLRVEFRSWGHDSCGNDVYLHEARA